MSFRQLERGAYRIIGAWKSLTELSPDQSSPDFAQTRLYQARAYVALNKPQDALNLLESDDSSLSVRAVRSLARYVAKDNTDKSLEDLRDLSLEIDEGVDEREKCLVRVIAGTAFALEGEIEEALETLGAGTGVEDLDAYVLNMAILIHSILKQNNPPLQYRSGCSNIPINQPR